MTNTDLAIDGSARAMRAVLADLRVALSDMRSIYDDMPDIDLDPDLIVARHASACTWFREGARLSWRSPWKMTGYPTLHARLLGVKSDGYSVAVDVDPDPEMRRFHELTGHGLTGYGGVMNVTLRSIRAAILCGDMVTTTAPNTDPYFHPEG